MVRQCLFILHRERTRRLCEVRWDFESRPPEQRSREEQRLFLQLGPSLVAVNVWLTALGADSGYAFGTIFEYAKVLLYTLDWLAQNPCNYTPAIPLNSRSFHSAELTCARSLPGLTSQLQPQARDRRSARQADFRQATRSISCLPRHGTCAWPRFQRFTIGSLRSICPILSRRTLLPLTPWNALSVPCHPNN